MERGQAVLERSNVERRGQWLPQVQRSVSFSCVAVLSCSRLNQFKAEPEPVQCGRGVCTFNLIAARQLRSSSPSPSSSIPKVPVQNPGGTMPVGCAPPAGCWPYAACAPCIGEERMISSSSRSYDRSLCVLAELQLARHRETAPTTKLPPHPAVEPEKQSGRKAHLLLTQVLLLLRHHRRLSLDGQKERQSDQEGAGSDDPRCVSCLESSPLDPGCRACGRVRDGGAGRRRDDVAEGVEALREGLGGGVKGC